MLTTAQFFEAFEAAGFLKLAAWTPSAGAGGGPEQTAQVRYKSPTHDALAGAVQNNEYSITYPSTKFIGLARAEVVSVTTDAGVLRFTVREDPHLELDGTRKMAPLSRIKT
jgi:hypothetical protein